MESTPVRLLDQLRGPAHADAWARFVHLYTPVLARWADRLGVPPGDRPDLLQDAFLSVYRGLPGFAPRPGHRFRGWLYTLLTNK